MTSESTSGKIIGPVFNVAIEQVDKVVDAAIAVVDLTQNAAFDTVDQTLHIGDKTADAAIAEIRDYKDRLVTLLSNYATAVTAALP